MRPHHKSLTLIFQFLATAGDGESATHSRTTNPRWLAPEVLRNGRSSRASDVFSFAVIMWEMLTWQIPYTGYFSLQVLQGREECQRL